MNKRDFIRTLGATAASLALGPELLDRLTAQLPEQLARDEPFWEELRKKFKLTSDYINLENGFYCFQPEPVLEAFIEHVRDLNLEASHYLRTQRDPDKLRIRTRLAGLAGCSPDELIVTRNTTESLDTVIAGFDWKPGDEAVMANQDYKAMLYMFNLQAKRHGVVNRLVDIPLDPRSDDEIVELYARAITPRTRLLMVSHMVNVTGHILPVRAICDMAHERGVPVMADGAHTFAHFEFRIPDLHCDYFGASLHKWLSAPLGSGILYVKQDRIEELWPIYGDDRFSENDILKLNHTGTHPAHTDLAIENAIAFHDLIGGARKEARLRFLQQYWVGQVRGRPRIVLNTPTDPRRSCAIANVGIEGINPLDLATRMLEEYKVWTVGYDGAGVHGLRVTPQVYTSTAELDTFVRALKELSA